MSADPYTQKAEHDAPASQKIQEAASIISSVKVGMLTTENEAGLLHSRAMSAAKENGLTLEFLANNQSGKFDEFKAHSNVNVSYSDPRSTDWLSISGKARISNDVEEIKRIYNPGIKSWFGDLGDGVNTGEPGDPRISVIIVTPEEIRYWKRTLGAVGQAFEVVRGAVTGQVATPGVLRTISQAELASQPKA